MNRELEQFDRLPPHDLEAERALIGSMFLEPACIPAVRAIVGKSEAFYQGDHCVLFDLLCERHGKDEPIDTALIREALKRRGLLEEIGGTANLAAILESVPSAAHYEWYAKIVRDRYVWRQGIAACNEFLRDAYRPHRGEEAGAEAARKVADRLSEASVSGFSDAFRKAGEVIRDVYESLERKERRFVPTGLTLIDQHCGGVPRGGFTLIGGRPGMGKSQTARQIAHNNANAGRPAAIITVEETAEKIGTNLLAARSGVKNSRIMFNQNLCKEDWNELAKALSNVGDLPLWINDQPTKLAEVVAAVTLAATKYRAQVIVVDYLQLIDPETGDNENREITLVSRALKAAFKRLDVAGVVAVQLNRGNEGAGGGNVRMPELRDLRGSGSLEQDGDLIVLLHREDYYHKGEDHYHPTNQISARVAKNKSGMTGVVPLLFDGDSQTVNDWPENDVLAPSLPPGV